MQNGSDSPFTSVKMIRDLMAPVLLGRDGVTWMSNAWVQGRQLLGDAVIPLKHLGWKYKSGGLCMTLSSPCL